MDFNPSTPDGRYFVVRGRLWRKTRPDISNSQRKVLTKKLMQARRGVGIAKRAGDRAAERVWRNKVNEAKIALGERGPVWWTDGAPDFNRRLAKNTPYAEWYVALFH